MCYVFIVRLGRPLDYTEMLKTFIFGEIPSKNLKQISTSSSELILFFSSVLTGGVLCIPAHAVHVLLL